eukprot:5139050-Amphidinium_carterae.1
MEPRVGKHRTNSALSANAQSVELLSRWRSLWELAPRFVRIAIHGSAPCNALWKSERRWSSSWAKTHNEITLQENRWPVPQHCAQRRPHHRRPRLAHPHGHARHGALPGHRYLPKVRAAASSSRSAPAVHHTLAPPLHPVESAHASYEWQHWHCRVREPRRLDNED